MSVRSIRCGKTCRFCAVSCCLMRCAGERMPADEWSRKLESYGLPFRYGDCTLLLVRMEEEFGQYTNNGQQLMEYAIINMAEEIFGEFTEVWGVKEEHGYLAVLASVQGRWSRHRKETILEKLAMQLQYEGKAVSERFAVDCNDGVVPVSRAAVGPLSAGVGLLSGKSSETNVNSSCGSAIWKQSGVPRDFGRDLQPPVFD